MKGLCVAIALMVASNFAAAAGSPVGTWRSIDDKTRQERSIIRITEENGELKGVVQKIFDQPGDDPAHLCKECKDERKDKPIAGMTILWGLKKDGDTWAGGEIFDPKNGKTYRCKMTLSEDGKSLNVRGFIGISLIGRTQTWLRQE
ncbi:MAG: DUF2147 domain-containing protein [Betaproteobacteria bacterium]|nr:DUF2147 domain-containing protein [Betaproteobacteria bacterium]